MDCAACGGIQSAAGNPVDTVGRIKDHLCHDNAVAGGVAAPFQGQFVIGFDQTVNVDQRIRGNGNVGADIL